MRRHPHTTAGDAEDGCRGPECRGPHEPLHASPVTARAPSRDVCPARLTGPVLARVHEHLSNAHTVIFSLPCVCIYVAPRHRQRQRCAPRAYGALRAAHQSVTLCCGRSSKSLVGLLLFNPQSRATAPACRSRISSQAPAQLHA